MSSASISSAPSAGRCGIKREAKWQRPLVSTAKREMSDEIIIQGKHRAERGDGHHHRKRLARGATACSRKRYGDAEGRKQQGREWHAGASKLPKRAGAKPARASENIMREVM